MLGSQVSQRILSSCRVAVHYTLYSLRTLFVLLFLDNGMSPKYLVNFGTHQALLSLKTSNKFPYVWVQEITISAKTSMPSFNMIICSWQFVLGSSMHIPNIKGEHLIRTTSSLGAIVHGANVRGLMSGGHLSAWGDCLGGECPRFV